MRRTPARPGFFFLGPLRRIRYARRCSKHRPTAVPHWTANEPVDPRIAYTRDEESCCGVIRGEAAAGESLRCD